MIEITLDGNSISYYGRTYTYFGYEKIDNGCIHLNLDDGWVCFLANQTIINGEIMTSSDQIISILPE